MNNKPEKTGDETLIRAFIAAPISEQAREKMAGIRQACRGAGGTISWVDPANIHLALLFLGAVFRRQAAPLAGVLDDVASANFPMQLTVEGVGYFGSSRSPRVIWAGLKGELDALAAMQADIADGVKNAGVFADSKPFNPHVTIARVRNARNPEALLSALEKYGNSLFGRMTVDRIMLVKSDLAAEGAIYTILHESPLSPRVPDGAI